MTQAEIPHALVQALVAHLRRAAAAHVDDGAALVEFAAAVDGAGREAPFQGARSRSVRGLRHLPAAFVEAPRGSEDLWSVARSAVGWAAWAEYYEDDPWSAPFLDRFANGDILGPGAPWRADDVIVGLYCFGPHIDYPPHAHAAEEVYVILTGAPAFRIGAEADYQSKSPGDVVLHRPNVAHGIRTGAEPVFGVYAWRGDLEAPAWYRVPMSDEAAEIRFPPIRRI